MKRSSIITFSIIVVLIVGITISIEAQSDATATKSATRTAQQEARQQRRAERLAKYERFVDSLVMSHNYRFVPQTMQQLPAGITRTLMNPEYEIIVGTDAVDVCIPYLKGYTPPYYPVVFNYILSSVQGYEAVKSNEGWHITFRSTMYTASEYTFTLEIYSRYGGATLTLSTPFYNTMQYTGNVVGI